MMRLHVIRHGKASAEKENYDELHPVGQQQARLLGEHLAATGQRFDAVYSGPLQRQLDTARWMRAAAGPVGLDWPTTTVLAGLAEAPVEYLIRVCLPERLPHDPELEQRLHRLGAAGANVGEKLRAIERIVDHLVALWIEGVFARPELESASDFGCRVHGALTTISAAHPSARDIAVVTSNGVIGWLLAHADGLPDPHRVATSARVFNSSVCRMAVSSGRLNVLSRNSLEHLADPMLHTFI